MHILRNNESPRFFLYDFTVVLIQKLAVQTEEHAKADDFIPHRYLTQLTVWQV
jgi:hypothetical protein